MDSESLADAEDFCRSHILNGERKKWQWQYYVSYNLIIVIIIVISDFKIFFSSRICFLINECLYKGLLVIAVK